MSKFSLNDDLSQLEALLQRTQYTFPSTVPVIGPIIQHFRQLWNNLSTRWYVEHAMEQAVAFDTKAAVLLRSLVDYVQRLESQQTQNIARIDVLEQKLLNLQEQHEIDLRALTRPTAPPQ